MKMKIKSLVEKMGGVQRFTFEPLIPTSRKSMSKFLDITKEEFSDYLDYLELFGGETGFIKEFKLIPYSDLPEYCYPDDDIPVGGNIEWSGGDLGFFYGENINYQKTPKLVKDLKNTKIEYQIIFYQYQVMNLVI